jgi:universal stress protein E
MRAVRRILVAVKDPSAKSLPAVERAVQLARAFRAELELFHGITEQLPVDAYMYQDGGLAGAEHRIRAQSYEGLHRLARHLEETGLEVNVSAEWDFPAYEAIVRRARRVKADLIVAECHAGRRLAPWLLHVTDWELLRTSPIPVLLVKSSQPYDHPVVLAALDPSHVFAKPVKLDEVILGAAGRLCRALQGTLHAVHAYAPMPVTIEPIASIEALGALPTLPQRAAQARKDMTRTIRGRVPRARQHLLADIAAEAIPQTARKIGASIVVMGAVSRSGLKRMLIGNTAERVLNELPCDVLVVKPKRFVTRVARKARGARLIVTPDMRTAYY